MGPPEGNGFPSKLCADALVLKTLVTVDLVMWLCTEEVGLRSEER